MKPVFLLLLSFIAGLAAKCRASDCAMPPSSSIPTFSNFDTKLSATGIVPTAGACTTFSTTLSFPLNASQTSECYQPKGTLLIELWLTAGAWSDASSSAVVDPLRVLPGLFLLATRAASPGQGPPTVGKDACMTLYTAFPNTLPTFSTHKSPHQQVSSDGNGKISFSPALASSGLEPQVTASYMDSAAVSNGKTLQRILIPVGSLFTSSRGSLDPTFFLTLSNMNAQEFFDQIGYAIRLTCMLPQNVRSLYLISLKF